MLKFGIRSKILLLISTILVFEIGFFIVLHQIMENSRRLVEQEKHARLVREVANMIGRTLGTGHSELEVYLATRNKEILDKLNTRNDAVTANIRKLRDLSQDDGELRKAIEELAEVSHKIILMQGVFLKQTADVNSLQFLLLIQQQVGLARENEKAQTKLDTVLKERLNLLEDKEREVSAQAELTVLSGLFCNIGVALLASLIFAKDIAGRLEHLAENASRFALNLPLKLKRGGNDEIGQLEAEFYDMAQAISNARDKEQAIINTLNIGLITIDSRFKIESLNPTAQALFGYTEDELVGHRLGKLFIGDDEREIIDSIDSVSGIHELQAKGKGRTFAADCFVTSLPVQPPKFLLSILDVTERQETERLRQDLIAMLSHDLRAPLTNIKATVELMRHHEQKREQDNEYLSQIDGTTAEIDRMMRLISDLLDIARMELGKFPLDRKMIPVWAPIQRSFNAVVALANQKNIAIEIEDTDLEVLADSDRLEQVFVNLLTNALKATDTGGTIAIKFIEEPNCAVVSIADSGCGISEDDIPHVFEKFYRPSDSESAEGYGLGLAICKTIIEQHGGNIRVESEPGKGTTFFVYLTRGDLDVLCTTCNQPQLTSTSGRLTQWLFVCSCRQDLKEQQSITLMICSTCGKRIVQRQEGTAMQFVFRSDTCKCDKPIMKQIKDSKDEKHIALASFFGSGEETELPVDSARFPVERYKPISILGKGAAGTVYLCRDRLLQKRVAVKVLHSVRFEDLVSFQNEARSTSKLSHPGIVQVMDFGCTTSGAPYMVLEYVPGVTLKEVFHDHGALEPSRVAQIFSLAASALAYAHGRGIYHRDIKPSNILLIEKAESLEVRIIDFGIAKVTANTISSQTTTIAGTPLYMPPDVVLNQGYSPSSEVYSLGCCIYEALTGAPPYLAETAIEVSFMHANLPLPDVSQRAKFEVSKELVDTVNRCLAKTPIERFQSMDVLAKQLESLIKSEFVD